MIITVDMVAQKLIKAPVPAGAEIRMNKILKKIKKL